MITDRSSDVRAYGARILRELGFSVIEASGVMDALVKCDAALPAFLIVDSEMAGALELISNIRLLPNGASVQIHYALAATSLASLMAGKRAGADDCLIKPFDDKILAAVFAHLAMAA